MTPDVEGSTLDPTEPASTVDPHDPGSTQVLPEAASHPGWVDEDLPRPCSRRCRTTVRPNRRAPHGSVTIQEITRVSFGRDARTIERHITCPHCSQPIELLIPTHPDEVICRSCGSRFRLTENLEAPAVPRLEHRFVGRFDVIQRVGSGGFGTVYKAHDPQLDRIVALKLLRVGNMATNEQQSRFLREARNAAQLRHQAIVPVHEIGHDDGIPFIVSDYIDGCSLSEWLADRKPSFRRIGGDDRGDRPGAAIRSRAGGHPSRRQAVECHARLGRPAASHGFRTGEA